MTIRVRYSVVWFVWCLALMAIVIGQALKWIAVPAWILVVFGFALLVFGLIWWAVGRDVWRSQAAPTRRLGNTSDDDNGEFQNCFRTRRPAEPIVTVADRRSSRDAGP